ncbi:hypothetical protein SAMN05444351_3542 [Geodermatophilus nigrescens]|uniref:Uncharacterized protein n=1 Tax=Geodermatophilus nigrescens TaxID=1070870 RepID=A0A1M5NG43_9ACTN|nr:hypothetical protein SAMN05444351_3542 [Geodermatophilus nigrescens]
MGRVGPVAHHAAPVTHLDGRRSYDARVVRPLRTGDPAEGDVIRLSPAGRRARLAASLVVLALLLAGTVWGTDAHFPFGPFKMYSTRASNDAPVVSTRVVGLTGDGREVRLSGGEVGLRRAEFEGQLPRLVNDPALLVLLADTYAEHHPGGPELVEVQVVQRHFELVDGEVTGAWTDEVLVEQELEVGP